VAGGQNLIATPGTTGPALSPAADDGQWPEGVEAFNNISLAELIEQANRYARKPIILSDKTIGTLRISGTFRFQDTGQVADKIAALLRLTVTDSGGNLILARSCGTDRTKSCSRHR
jgi:transmembrane sensor